jgi:predicted nuclease with RNAse H fold
MISVGIDLAGSGKRDTGFCSMNERMHTRTMVLRSDEEILSETVRACPDIVSIDAPLFLPKGRPSLEHKGPPHLRSCDKELLRMKIKFFPITLGPMRMLTARGIFLRGRLESLGLRVIESYPGAIQDILQMPRKQRGVQNLRRALTDYGLKGDVTGREMTGDELDAITSALVGIMYLRGDYLAIGDPQEGLMILPGREFTI